MGACRGDGAGCATATRVHAVVLLDSTLHRPWASRSARAQQQSDTQGRQRRSPRDAGGCAQAGRPRGLRAGSQRSGKPARATFSRTGTASGRSCAAKHAGSRRAPGGGMPREEGVVVVGCTQRVVGKRDSLPQPTSGCACSSVGRTAAYGAEGQRFNSVQAYTLFARPAALRRTLRTGTTAFASGPATRTLRARACGPWAGGPRAWARKACSRTTIVLLVCVDSGDLQSSACRTRTRAHATVAAGCVRVAMVGPCPRCRALPSPTPT